MQRFAFCFGPETSCLSASTHARPMTPPEFRFLTYTSSPSLAPHRISFSRNACLIFGIQFIACHLSAVQTSPPGLNGTTKDAGFRVFLQLPEATVDTSLGYDPSMI